MIAHIEPSFSGYGTSESKDEAKDDASSPSAAPVHVLTPNTNSELVDRLVALAEAPKLSDPQRPTHKLFRSPVAVASLAGFTVIALTASLAWIVHGQRPFGTGPSNKNPVSVEESQATKRAGKAGASGAPELMAVTPRVSPAEIPASSPLMGAPPALSPPVPSPVLLAPTQAASIASSPSVAAPPVLSPPTVAQPTPTLAPQAIPPKPRAERRHSIAEPSAKTQQLTAQAEPKANLKKPVADKNSSKEVKAKEQLVQEQALQERRRQVVKASTATSPPPKAELAKAQPLPQALGSEPSHRSQNSEVAKPMARAEPQLSAPSVKQASATEAKTRDLKGNVEALCSERSNFLSRGYCQTQYCAEPHRKNDPTCQRLRQYETARQSSVNY